nr:hypothetical protein [uncultured Oscillibacter sp.]
MYTRMTHAAAYNDEKIVYVLNSAENSAGVVYEGWRIAARIGGMIAAVASNMSLTHTVITGLAPLSPGGAASG